jgi:hypothetical protein
LLLLGLVLSVHEDRISISPMSLICLAGIIALVYSHLKLQK